MKTNYSLDKLDGFQDAKRGQIVREVGRPIDARAARPTHRRIALKETPHVFLHKDLLWMRDHVTQSVSVDSRLRKSNISQKVIYRV